MTTTWVYFQRPGFSLYQEDGGVLTSTAQTVKRAQDLRNMAARRAPNLQAAPYNPAGYEYCAFDGQRVVNLFARDDLAITPRTVIKTDQGSKTLAQVLDNYEITDRGIDPKAAAWDIQALREAVNYANAYTLTRLDTRASGPFGAAGPTRPDYWTLTRPDTDTECTLRTCYRTQEGSLAHKPTLEASIDSSDYFLVSLPKDCIPLFDGTGTTPTQDTLRTLARAVDDAATNPFCLERDIQGVAYALTRGGARLEFYLENVGSFTYTNGDLVAHETHGDPAYTMGRSMLVKNALKNYSKLGLVGVYFIVDALVRQRVWSSGPSLWSEFAEGYRAACNGRLDVCADALPLYVPSRSTHPETRRNDPYSTYYSYVAHYRKLIKADAAKMAQRAN